MKNQYGRAALAGSLTGATLFIVLIGTVLATGQTFGQRCEKAFPSNPARAELCVHNLSNGYAP